jgi:hypothetical protein
MALRESMPGNASKSSRLRRYPKKIYLLYVMEGDAPVGHYVMGGLSATEGEPWLGWDCNIEFSKQL